MSAETRIIEITDGTAAVVEPAWLRDAEPVHRQLRPGMPPDYLGTMGRVFADGGRMCVATRTGAVVGVAVYRTYENTFDGLHLYVDDLVTDEAVRSSGVGGALLGHLRARARQRGCRSLTLDSGTRRERAHAFYFREGLTITSFHFAAPLLPAG